MKKLIRVLLACVLIFTLVACGKENEKEGETKNIKIGLIGTDSLVWKHVAEKVKEKGINLEIVFFDSYPLPNAALNSKEIDLNAFQHHIYLDKEVEQFGYKIEAVKDTLFAPLGIYSEKIKNISELKDGQKVAIPDDVSNGGRAIKILEKAGLIKVNPDAGLLPNLKDIIENSKNLEFVELSAANIPATLSENEIAVINSGIATDNGFTPSKDALVLEEAVEGENPYINVIAARTEDKDEEWLKIILEAYTTKEVHDLIIEDSKGGSIPVWEAE